jgi:hypothetical protein
MLRDENVETRDHSLNAQLELLISNFDFELVNEICEHFNFTYLKTLTEEEIPSVDTLKEMARNLLEEVITNINEYHGNCNISSGRLEAGYSVVSESLYLKFVPEEKEIYYDEGNESIFVA